MATSGGDGADIPSSGGDFVPPAGGGRGAQRRTHARSASHGGTAWSHHIDVSHSPHEGRSARHNYLPSSSHTAAPPAAAAGRGQGASVAGPISSCASSGSPPQSILINPGVGAARVRTHHRTFSHGQTIDGVTGPHQRGHRRAGSRTDFILPDGHEQRERERRQAVAAKPSLGRTSSFPLGHKRNASKTESIYTIRENKISLLQRLLIFLGKSLPAEVSTRTVVLNHTQPLGVTNPNDVYPSNRVTTTKYNLLTFIPKNLFEQFHRFANIYFLFIVLLNFVPSINAFAKEVAMLPLLFVLSVTALKDLFEDRRRYNSDKRVNNSVCRVYCSSSKSYVDRTWKELRVGDVVHLRSNELVPADILLLNSSDPHGVCYIDSCNLDGETSLKQRQSVRGLGMDSDFDPSQLNFSVEISPPTTKIYHFLGSIPVEEGGRRIALNESNLLLRSCFVKNTDFVEGLVVYAGSETKVMLNSSSSRYKRSRLERHMNTAVVCCVAILLVMCLLAATGSGVWQAYFDKASAAGVIPFLPPVTSSPNDGREGTDTLEELVRGELSEDASPAVKRLSTSPGWVAFLSFWTYVIIFQVIIPIALYVTIEIIKMLQVYHIQNDPNFVDPRTGTSIECRAMNITEELGQVQYVFTDKTGTLTENNMIFQRCSINGVDYEHQITVHDTKSDQSSSNECGDSFEINDQLYDDLHTPGFPVACSHQQQQQQQDSTPSLAYHQRAPLVHQDDAAQQQPQPRRKNQKKLQPDSKSQQQQHSLQKHLQQQDPEVHQERILNFMLTLVLCNTVIVAKTSHTDESGERIGVIPPTPGTANAGGYDFSPSSVLTPSRLIPSLRAFTPLIRIPPLPERPHLNFRALNPFSRPLSPIASSPSASPEVFPKHRIGEDGVASLRSSMSQQEAEPSSDQFFTPSDHEVQNGTSTKEGFLPLDFLPEGEPSLASEPCPDSEISSCATFYTDVPFDPLSTPAGGIASFPSISPSVSAGVKAAEDQARHSTPTKGVPSKNTSAQDAESVSTASNVFDTFGSSLGKASESNEGAAFSPSFMNLVHDVPSDSQSTNLPLINLTLNPFSEDSRETSNNSSRRTSTSLSNTERSNGAFISCSSENFIGINNCSDNNNTNSNSNQASCSSEIQIGKSRVIPPKTLQIPSLKHFAPRSPRSLKQQPGRVSEQDPGSSSNPFRGQASGPTGSAGLASGRVTLPGSAEVSCASSVSAAGMSSSGASSLSKNQGLEDEHNIDELSLHQKPLYEAESPDELALVEAAYKYGLRLLRRDAHAALIDVPGSGLVQFEVLHVFPFDSTRKRMSVMVRDPRSGHITLFCKGADSAILDNLDRACDQLDQFRQFRTHQHLYVYSKCGLRTLCVATRRVSEAEYAWWRRGHDEAEASFADREFKLQNSYKLMEKNLILLGATGIEDRLQPLVPETLAALRKAGIIIWLLTGDKQETAVNVAHSAALFSPTMQIMKLNARTREQAEVTIRRFLESCSLRGSRHAITDDDERGSTLTVATAATDASAAASGSGIAEASAGLGYVASAGLAGAGAGLAEAETDGDVERGLVVDGKTLTFILDRSTNLLPLFLELAEQCRSVLISRATPLQKALVVKLTKQSLGILSMAVGDGANDVSMIQTADVGVGISGVEGRQAVMSSDFAISRFCHLRRLLLLHGHWCHHRLASIILYFFYKNANLVLVLLWYQFYCSFTGNNFLDQMYLIQFSLTFTSVPPVIIGAYDKDAPSSVLLSEPHLYSEGRRDEAFKHSYFWVNILDAAYQSLIMFFFAVGAFYDGGDSSSDLVALTVVHSCLLAQLLTIALEVKSWTILHVSSLLFSLGIFHAFSIVYTMTCVSCFSGLKSVYWVYPHAMSSLLHWCVVILSALTCVLPRFVYRCSQTSLWPSDVQLSVLRYREQLKGQRSHMPDDAGDVAGYGCP